MNWLTEKARSVCWYCSLWSGLLNLDIRHDDDLVRMVRPLPTSVQPSKQFVRRARKEMLEQLNNVVYLAEQRQSGQAGDTRSAA